MPDLTTYRRPTYLIDDVVRTLETMMNMHRLEGGGSGWLNDTQQLISSLKILSDWAHEKRL